MKRKSFVEFCVDFSDFIIITIMLLEVAFRYADVTVQVDQEVSISRLKHGNT